MLAIKSLQNKLSDLENHAALLEEKSQQIQNEIDILQKTDSKFTPKLDLFPDIGQLVENKNLNQPQKDELDDDDDEKSFDETGMRTSELGVTEIQSLCLNCEENGVTKLLLTKIPFFQEIILMAFSCPHCGYRDTQIKPGAPVQEKGVHIVFRVTDSKDLNRQIIKSDSCTLRIEELDFEIPAARGVITNLEGLLSEAAESLSSTQEQRMLLNGQEAVDQVDNFLSKLNETISGKVLPLTVILDDPSGNSFIDNPNAPHPDPKLKESKYIRTPEQQAYLGLIPDEKINQNKNDMQEKKNSYKTGSVLKKENRLLDHVASGFASEEVISIPSPCPQCNYEGNANTCIVNLPFFKEVIVMAFNCEECGFRDTEIKGGGAIPKQARREILLVQDPSVDMSRDIIKSDTAGVIIPELGVELTRGSLGGLYTTIEGLLNRMKEDLFGNKLFQGDSQESERKRKFDELEKQFDECISGTRPFTLIVEDPLANSYIYSPFDPPESDPRLKVELYDRSWDEDEELGLHDMNVDHAEFTEVEDTAPAEMLFTHMQPGQDLTHPNKFTQGE